VEFEDLLLLGLHIPLVKSCALRRRKLSFDGWLKGNG
jgi:hypothetical protein